MEQSFKEIYWNQFGASIDALENAIEMCPEGVWDNERKFWYNAYHCLFFLDYYLTLEPAKFAPQPIAIAEFEDRMPETAYTKVEILEYLEFCREKCRDLIAGLTDEIAEGRWVNAYKNYPFLEILLYNMRHVQHHAAQLNLILREEIGDAPDWVSQTKERLT
jgi:hypothetical protein